MIIPMEHVLYFLYFLFAVFIYSCLSVSGIQNVLLWLYLWISVDTISLQANQDYLNAEWHKTDWLWTM